MPKGKKGSGSYQVQRKPYRLPSKGKIEDGEYIADRSVTKYLKGLPDPVLRKWYEEFDKENLKLMHKGNVEQYEHEKMLDEKMAEHTKKEQRRKKKKKADYQSKKAREGYS